MSEECQELRNIKYKTMLLNGNNKKTLNSVIKDVAIPPRPPVLCPGCSHRGVFYVMKKLRLAVTGDIGCYTLAAIPPLEMMDTCLCMGASIGYAEGIGKATGDKLKGKLIGVIGDSTFYHSGITGLLDVVYNQGKTKVCILDNHITAMTGHQEHPGSGLTLKGDAVNKVDIEALCRATGVKRVVKVDPYNLDETLKVFKEEMAADEPSVIIAEAPCVIRARKRFSDPYYVVADKCTKCGLCHKVGCPAIEKDDDGKAKINKLFCIGCDVCRQVCNFEAINRPE